MSAASFGAFCAALYALLEGLYHAPQLSVNDWFIAILYAVLPGAAGFVTFALLLRMASRVLVCPLSRRAWVAALTAFAVMGLAAVVVLTATNSFRNFTGLLIVLGSIPVAGITAGLASKIRWVDRPWRVPMVSLFALATVVTSAAATGLLKGRGSAQIAKGAGIGDSRSDDTAAQSARPNVVMIVLDTTRRDMLGCYGHQGGLTPVLDTFAARSTVYEDAFTPAPWTVPAHASLFTGLYPMTHGCSYEHKVWLDAEFVTIAEVLRQAGYRTIGLTSNHYLRLCNLMQGFEHSGFLHGPYDDLAIHEFAQEVGFPEHWTDKGCSEAVADLRAWVDESGPANAPFFLFINLLEAHEPYLPPMAERRRHLNAGAGYWETSHLIANLSMAMLHARASLDPRTRKLARAMYEAEVRYQDRRLGEMLPLIERLVTGEPTLFIITADHGEELGEAGRWGHALSLSDQLVNVPLVIRYPGAAHSGTRVSGLCSLIDIFPTVMEATGAAFATGGLPGRAVTPGKFTPRPEVFLELDPFHAMLAGLELRLGFRSSVAQMRTFRKAIRTGEWKYIAASNGLHELYDLALDPDESDNLFGLQPAIQTELSARLAEWKETTSAYVPTQADRNAASELKDSDVDRLRGLGYVK